MSNQLLFGANKVQILCKFKLVRVDHKLFPGSPYMQWYELRRFQGGGRGAGGMGLVKCAYLRGMERNCVDPLNSLSYNHRCCCCCCVESHVMLTTPHHVMLTSPGHVMLLSLGHVMLTSFLAPDMWHSRSVSHNSQKVRL